MKIKTQASCATSKKRKAIFRSLKKNSNRKKHLAKISKKAAFGKQTWTHVIENRLKRYFDAAFEIAPALHPGNQRNEYILRLTASRVYKTFLPSLVYNENVQYAHKDICIASEKNALDVFMEKKTIEYISTRNYYSSQIFFHVVHS